jgi:hypothetical protein
LLEMAKASQAEALHGLALPPGVVQPFDMRFSGDDFHVIAFVQGHPVYEAVEALIRMRGSEPAAVRAILTRHDQTQVDHVNDDTTFAQAQTYQGRLTVRRDIVVQQEGASSRPCLAVHFASFANEPVMLRVQAAGPADAARGGLTDPGRHALTSGLPLMWRSRSGLAGEGTGVTISGMPYEVKERFRSPNGFVGLDGFYTEGFRMGAMRASTQSFEVLEEPVRIGIGSTWRYACSDKGEVLWVVTGMPSPQQVVIETQHGSRSERVLGETDGRSLRLLTAEVAETDRGGQGFCLRMLPEDRFAMDVADGRELVTGDISMQQQLDGAATLRLSPQHPGWANARPVTIQVHRAGKQVTIVSAVGTEPSR